jgi:hypothetical protein
MKETLVIGGFMAALALAGSADAQITDQTYRGGKIGDDTYTPATTPWKPLCSDPDELGCENPDRAPDPDPEPRSIEIDWNEPDDGYDETECQCTEEEYDKGEY